MPLYMFLRIGSTGIQEASDKQDVENQYNKLSHVHVPLPIRSYGITAETVFLR